MKKSRIALAFIASASLIVAACGSDDGETATTEAPATSEAPGSSEAPSTEAPAEELTASDIGITAETIKIGVAISDL